MKEKDGGETPEWCNQDVIKISQRSFFQNLNVNKRWSNTVQYKF